MAERQNIPDAKYIELHSAGLINARIAAALNVKPSAVTYRLKKLGLTPNRAERAPKPAPLPPPPVQQVETTEIQPSRNGTGVVRHLDEVTLGSAVEDLLIDLDRARNEVSNAKLNERQRMGAYKDAATALKTIEGVSKARVAVHDGWAEHVIKAFSGFAQRVESALARHSEQTGGTITLSDLVDVLGEESRRVQKSVKEYYMNETEGLHR